MTKKLAVVFAISLCAWTPAVLASGYDDSAEAWETVLDLRIADGVLQTYIQRSQDPIYPAEWVLLSRFSKQLPNLYRTRLPRSDAWGRGFLIGVVRKELVVLSSGEDGLDDTTQPLRDLTATDSRYVGKEVRGDDIVLVVGHRVFNGPRTLSDHQKRTMADLRSIGTAVESYSIDNNLYPRQVDGLRDVHGLRLFLEPVYIRTLPMKDSWGNPFVFWSNERSYVIVSAGVDGKLDRSYVTDTGSPIDMKDLGATADPNADIVFADGVFVQWPEGIQQ